MRFGIFFFLLFLGFLILSLAQGSYEDCCLRYMSKVKGLTPKRVLSYKRQEMDGSCNIQAIVFKTIREKLICADPKEKWVMDLMRDVDNRTKRHKHLKKKHSKS